MNRYGQMVLDHNRQHRPDSYSQIPNPVAFFAKAGEVLAADVIRLRDEILGPSRPGESPETYRLRSYQALEAAEELILADHYLLQPGQPNETGEHPSDDPDLARRYLNLDEINRTINTPL